jgi:hypothetical protein
MNKSGRLVLGGIVALVFVVELTAAETRKFGLEVEAGPVWQGRNDVRIPNESGTRFSLHDIQGSGPYATGRVSFDYSISPKHELRLLAAPFSITAAGTLSEGILFAGRTFASGSSVRAIYQFNSYRLTYRYRIFEGERWRWKFGVTGKIRDARIELHQHGNSTVDKNVGLVPLLHLDGEYRWADRWSVGFNMDGLAAPQGRAMDAAVKLRCNLSKNWTVSAGYRVLEGGADTKDVYAFGWFHYAALSVGFRF